MSTYEGNEPGTTAGRTHSREEVEALMADILQANVWDAEVWQAAGKVMEFFGIPEEPTTPARVLSPEPEQDPHGGPYGDMSWSP